MLPIPLLRREARNYCTIVQDLLGNSFNEPSSEFSIPTTAETIFANIYNHESMLLGEYRTPKSKNSLFKARWLIAKNPDKSELKNFTYSALRRRKTLEDMFLLQILNVLKGTIRSHCRTVISKLERIDELKTFMSEYCISVILMQWEAYSASISNIDPIFLPLSILINTVYSGFFTHKFRHPPFSVMRLMIIMWRRYVFSKISGILVAGVLRLIQNIRMELKNNAGESIEDLENTATLLMRY